MQYYLTLIDELLGRYDINGGELDWMRIRSFTDSRK